MRADRRKAIELVEAYGGGARGRDDVSPGTARLLDAAGVLVAAAPASSTPDPLFAAKLRSSLLSRYQEPAVSPGMSAPARSRARRAVLIVVPAAVAVAALLLGLALLVFRPSGPAAVARLTVQEGFVRVLSEGEDLIRITDEADLGVGDRVETAPGSRATITYRNESITRLEAGSGMAIQEYDDGSVAVDLYVGKAYNRVVGDVSFSVTCRGVTSQASGTAFGLDDEEQRVLVPVFESAARVRASEETRFTNVDQGFLGIASGSDGTAAVEVVPLDLAQLDFSWLAYNRDLDRELGFPLGVLEELEPTPPGGVVPPGDPASSAPGEPKPGERPVDPQAPPSTSLTVAGSGPPVLLSWSASNVGSADSLAVLRTDGGTAPSYPANTLSAGPSAGVTSYNDTSVEEGRTYSYRVAYLAGGTVLAYSNPVTVTVPSPAPPPPPPVPPTLHLGGSLSEQGMRMKWYLEGSASIDSWSVLASQKDSSPAYPGSQVAVVAYSGSVGSYLFSGGGQTAPYFLRVAGLSGGKVVVYSNVIRSGP